MGLDALFKLARQQFIRKCDLNLPFSLLTQLKTVLGFRELLSRSKVGTHVADLAWVEYPCTPTQV
jgi:hypothetical protein